MKHSDQLFEIAKFQWSVRIVLCLYDSYLSRSYAYLQLHSQITGKRTRLPPSNSARETEEQKFSCLQVGNLFSRFASFCAKPPLKCFWNCYWSSCGNFDNSEEAGWSKLLFLTTEHQMLMQSTQQKRQGSESANLRPVRKNSLWKHSPLFVVQFWKIWPENQAGTQFYCLCFPLQSSILDWPFPQPEGKVTLVSSDEVTKQPSCWLEKIQSAELSTLNDSRH